VISDEIEELRKRGRSDQEIASLTEASSSIKITTSEVADNYASSKDRHRET